MRLHQLLHGYRDGHRLLASSAPAEVAAERQLLTMSDASGPGLPTDHSGYMTGYPLKNTKFYALARTWPAPEMSRPGCVWTHTLLIDLVDLAALVNVRSLMGHFVRPVNSESSDGFESYCSPILESPDTHVYQEPIRLPRRKTELILYGLYGRPSRAVYLTTQDEDAEEVVLASWLQQWPRLRRSFRFCTLSLLSTSSNQEAFDLQIVPRGTYSRATKSIFTLDDEVEIPKSENDWIGAAADDLSKGNGGLRRFLWKYGADTDAGRHAFRPLTNAWLAFQQHQDSQAISIAISNIENFKSGNAIKGYLAEKVAEAAARSETLDAHSLRFLVGNHDLVHSDYLDSGASNIARSIYETDIKLIWQMLGARNEQMMRIACEAATLLTVEDLEDEHHLDESVLLKAIQLNPDLLVSTMLWGAKPELVKMTLNQVIADPKMAEKITDSAIANEADFLAELVVEKFGRIAIARIIRFFDSEARSDFSMSKWMQAIAVCSQDILSVLLDGNIRRQDTLASLASRMSHRVYFIGEKEPWLRATKKADDVPEDGGIPFCGFLVARAFSGKSPESGQLLAAAFDSVYTAAWNGDLDYQTWRIVSQELPFAPFWKEWDRCYRLILGVSKLFVERDLPVRQYLKVTSDDRVFARLVEETAEQYRGKDYIKRVLKGLKKGKSKHSDRSLRDALRSKYR